MVMKGMSERAYAAKSGLSRGAVQKARKTGRLVLYPDGSINVAASDARRSAMTDPDQQMRARGGFGGGGSGESGSGPGDSTSYLKARTALTEPPRLYRRVICSTTKRPYRVCSGLHRMLPLLLRV